MAAFYELRYWKNFEQPDGSIIRLEIHSKGIEGISFTAYEIGPVVQALALTVQGQTEDIDAPIVKTSLSMTFVDAPDHADAWLKKCGDWEEFYTNDSTYWKVLIKAKKNASSASYAQLWGGYITPDSFSEELRYRGSVTIVARDNIGHMQDFPFDAEGDENGLISLKELVETAWAKIESPMSLYWPAARWLECEGVYAFDTRMNVSAFKDMNWYDAVEKALYSYGAVMRYNGENQVLLCSLRYMPQQARPSMDQVTHIEPIFIAHAQRELIPAARRIEEVVNYDIEDYIFPKLSETDFTGGTESFLIDGNSVDYKGVAWTIKNKISGLGWCCPDYSMFFNPSAYSFYIQNGNDDDFNFLVCNTYGLEGNIGYRYAEFSRQYNSESVRLDLKFGQPYAFNINGELIPSGRLETVTVAIIIEQNGIKNYLQKDMTWGVSEFAHILPADNLGIEIPPSDFSGSLMMKVQIHHIKTTGAAKSIASYIPLYRASFSVNSAILQKNTVNTKYHDSNNVILSREPEIAPAYNSVALPGFIKNGIFYYDGNVIKPAKAWSWDGGTPQQMAVYNHLQLLCYHSKPNNLITGDIVNADVIKTAAIYVWGGKEHLLISGTYNYLNGRIEGAALREFVRYDDMWGEVSGTSLPDTEQSSTTNQEGGGSLSGPSSTNENTTNVVIGGEGGGSVTIDPFLSDTSTNAVQNKAIKAYVDAADKALSDRITDIEENGAGGGGQIDTAMSDTSENAVQNKVIKKYVDQKSRDAYENAYNDAVNASKNYTDSAKQQLIAEKAGAFYVEPSTDLFIVFTTEKKKAAYIASGDESGVLGKFALGGGGGASETLYDMQVINLQPSFSFTTSSEKMMISAGFRSMVKYAEDSSYQTFNESAIFSVEVYKQGSASSTVVSAGNVVANGGTFSIDMKPYVGNGNNTVIIRAAGLISSKEGVASTTIAVTTMSLSAFGFDWAKAWVQGQDYRINLRVQGSLAKTLYVQINGKTVTESVGTWNSADVAYGFDLKAANHPASSGVYQLKMWLKADASGITSETLTYNIMCVKASEASTAKLVCINEVATEVDNYSESKIFAYAAYNGGGSSATPTLSIQKGSTTIASSSVSVNTGVQHDFTYAFALAMTETSAAITAKAVFGNTQTASITLKNETSFAPVSGYNFYMNAATRSNGDAYKTYLVNEANGERIYASWNDMAWVDGMDGWTTDEDGNKCLLIPALSKAYVSYAPMQNASVLTLELQYKVKNVSDFSEDIITIASGAASSWMGVKVKPTNITLHSQSLFTDDLKQGYNLQDEKMVHLVVAIIQNYQSTGNIAVIYVNGVKKCSFEWSRGDSFSHGGELVLGSDTADLYLYMMRVYATQFDWPQVMQNYISSIHSAAEKAQTKRREDSVLADNDTLDYDKIYGKYNTFVVELPRGAALPNILNPSEVEGTNLYIDIVQDRSCTIQGEFLNVPLEGQGTTAMTYYRWNLRSKTDTIRITAKKNVASSMHSHKMGATRLFNDLNRAIVGPNEANGRVAVYQYPVYGFQKVENEDAPGTYYYDFIGLYTIGPDKGDKPTFGYDNKTYKSTLIHMEGTDHSPRGVGMDYPWEQMTVGLNVDKDAFIGPKNSLGQLGDEAWEIGACGDKETASEMKAYLDVEFAPAYNLDYECTPLIAALPSGETISSVNANVAAFRAREAWEGFTYGDCIIFDANYDTYYFNEVSQSYVADGRKAYEGLLAHGFSTANLASASDKAAYIREYRKARYRAEMGSYWHLNDNLFQVCFLDLTGATDNEKKNSYPYKFGTLASGSRWRWRQDDLDTIFDVYNQGLAGKLYSILNTDKQDGTMIYKGNTSYHWRCIREYYKDELKTMMQTIFAKMISLSPYGSSEIQKLVGCIHHYFWDYAQEYFTGGAYNLDAKWTYEDTWRIYKSNNSVNAVHPLQQSLGSHYEAEVAWVTLRMLFLASMNEYGAFVTYSDISEGQIAFRQGGDFTFNLTPAIDMRPSVIQGQSKTGAKFASGRVKAGDTAVISTTADSSADTMVHVQAADWLSDAGDFCKVRLGSTSRTFAITSKRLQKIKVGDATASKVTTNIEGLDIGACPSVEEIDARNITALHGEVDLTKCPRLRRAYFGGTSATSILLPDGSKIQTYDLPSTIQRLTLRKLPLLTASGITSSGLNALSYLWVEDNKRLEGYALLKSALEGGSPLNNIRVVGFDVNGTTADIEFLKTLANGEYHAVDEQGNPDNASLPYLEGGVSIGGGLYEDDLENVNAIKSAFPNVNLVIIGGIALRFDDAAVVAVLNTRGVGADGKITSEDAEGVTSLLEWFRGNTEIMTFNELRYFINVKTLDANAFDGCSALQSIDLSMITSLGDYAFQGTSALGDISAPSLVSAGIGVFRNSGVTKANNLGNLTNVATGGYGLFELCKNLQEVIFPSSVKSLGAYVCQGCSSLRMVQCLAVTPPSLGVKGFDGVPGFIYVPDASVDAYKSATNWATYASKIYAVKYAVPANNIAIGSVTTYQTIGQTGAVSDDVTKAVTDYIPVNGGNSITWGSSMGRDMLLEFDENFVKVDHWSSTGSSRTITTNSRTRYVRTGFVIPAIAFSYVKDNTTGEYLFKGKEV